MSSQLTKSTKIMKKKYIISSLAALSVLAIAAGATSVLAASPNASSTVNSLMGKLKMRSEQSLTAEQKTQMQEKIAERETIMAERETKMAAMKATILSGDYTAWVAAEKTLNPDSPLLTKITAANFNKFVEAVKLQDQADSIMKELGIEGREGMGPGMGRGMGLGLGLDHERGEGGLGLGRGGHGKGLGLGFATTTNSTK